MTADQKSNSDSETGMKKRIWPTILVAAADPGMSTSLHSVGLLDMLSSIPVGPSVALAGTRPSKVYIFGTGREAPSTMPVCAASLRNIIKNSAVF